MMTNQVAPRDLDDDAALMVQVRDRNCQDAFGQLVRQWRDRVERLCYRLCGNLADAEDLTQEAFQKVFRFRSRYEPSAKFSTYLYKIATNCCRDFAKSRRRKGFLQEADWARVADPKSTDAPMTRDVVDCIQRTIWSLPRHYREVIVLRHYEDLSFAEIAELLEIPRGTAASRMAKALRILEAEFVKLDLIPQHVNA
jgi:RNA polymerase sigma-70 factor (ECF subfamily)